MDLKKNQNLNWRPETLKLLEENKKGNWGAKWKVYAIAGSAIVDPAPLQMYSKLSWHSGGAGAPILRIKNLHHSSPWHTSTWKMGLPFVDCQTGQFQLIWRRDNAFGYINIWNIKHTRVTICTSHPYLFVAIPGTPQFMYNETSTVYTFTTTSSTIHTSCLIHVNVTWLNITIIFVICIQAQAGFLLTLLWNRPIWQD